MASGTATSAARTIRSAAAATTDTAIPTAARSSWRPSNPCDRARRSACAKLTTQQLDHALGHGHQLFGARLAAAATATRPLALGHVEQGSHAVAIPGRERVLL